MQKNENKKENVSWKSVEECLASEIIGGREHISKVKDYVIAGLITGMAALGIVMAVIYYKNDCDWRELFSSYDYVSQDGEGYNYYNSGVGGNVSNGSENQKTEEQEQSERNGN